MSTLGHRAALAAIFVTGLASGLDAQRATRGVKFPADSWTPLPRAYFSVTGGDSMSVNSLATSFDVSTRVGRVGGAVAWCPAGYGNAPYHYLVAGGDATSGILQHWVWADFTQAPILQSNYVQPGSDFAGVAWDETNQRVFVLDCVQDEVLLASWDGTIPLAAAPWGTLADTLQLPGLVDSEAQTLRYLEASSRLEVVPYSGEIEFVMQLVPGDEVHYVDLSGFVGYGSYTVAPDALPFIVDRSFVREGSTAVVVEVAETDTFTYELVDTATGTVLGSAAPSPGAGICVIPSSTPLQLGWFYQVRRAGTVLEGTYSIECRAVYGYPETTPAGTEVGHIHHAPWLALGSDQFKASVVVDLPTLAQADPNGDTLLIGVFGYAFRSGGVDPVVPWGTGNNLLSAEVTEVVTHNVHGPFTGRLSGSSILVPNDPSLVGTVLFQQFALIENGLIYVSDIEGVVIRPPV